MTNINWISSKSAIKKILASQPAGQQFHYPISSGSMRVGLYSPKDKDEQTPHTQDELYITASGTGWFVRGDQRIPFAPQDVLFVPAGMPHRFEDFSADFSTWVVFWGPKGGEVDR